MKVLALNPHPDDEVLGAGATLLALRRAGAEVVCVACGLGSDPERRASRREEAREACRRAGWRFRTWLERGLEPLLEEGWDLVVAPHPADAHPAHRRVGEAVRAAPGVDRWWAWGLWADVARPSLLVPFGMEEMGVLAHALAAHASERERGLDLLTLLRARAELARVLAPEKIWGHGRATPLTAPFAEALEEWVGSGGGWVPAAPRVLDPALPLPSALPGR